MNCKNESVTSIKSGFSAGATNATELSASRSFAPLTPPGALPQTSYSAVPKVMQQRGSK